MKNNAKRNNTVLGIIAVAIALVATLIGSLLTASADACDHTAGYENGFCKGCDAYEAPKLNGGLYEIDNAGKLYWFAD